MLVQNTNLPAAIIVDMDATVCLNTSGRPFYGEVNGYFIPKNLDESIFYLTDLDVIPRN